MTINQNTQSAQTIDSNFAQDVIEGLTKHPKTLPSKYFYDQIGDKIFQEIMEMPEYYLTQAEREILSEQSHAIIQRFPQQPFDLIELGAGDGTKTQRLIEALLEADRSFTYRPLDISPNSQAALKERLSNELPNCKVDPLTGDYFTMLAGLSTHKPKVILFLGANIGNYDQSTALELLHLIRKSMTHQDLMLVGFDLKKQPQKILAAYADPAGITARFNLNLLQRINTTFDGNICLEKFEHFGSYNPENGEARSYLISKEHQHIHLKGLDLHITLDAWETIHTEISKKYAPADIAQLGHQAGFQLLENFVDRKVLFSDSLFKAVWPKYGQKKELPKQLPKKPKT